MVGQTTVIYILVSFDKISYWSSSLEYSVTLVIFSFDINVSFCISSIIIDASNSFDFSGDLFDENRNDHSLSIESIVNNNMSFIKSLIFEKRFMFNLCFFLLCYLTEINNMNYLFLRQDTHFYPEYCHFVPH